MHRWIKPGNKETNTVRETQNVKLKEEKDSERDGASDRYVQMSGNWVEEKIERVSNRRKVGRCGWTGWS